MDVDIIIHLAAQVSVADSMVDTYRYRWHNTDQMYDFINSLRMCVQNGHVPKRMVVASSSSVYGNVPLPFAEHGPVDPCNVYGLTKLDQEQLTKMWCRNLGIKAVALRFFNIYGPGQASHNVYTGVLANFARMMVAGERPKITEDGQQLRDFIHVHDIADAIVLAATAEEPQHDCYNVCTGRPTSMLTATKALNHALGTDMEPEVTGDFRVGDQRHVLGSYARLADEFAWAPRPFTEGIKDYAAWLSKFL